MEKQSVLPARRKFEQALLNSLFSPIHTLDLAPARPYHRSTTFRIRQTISVCYLRFAPQPARRKTKSSKCLLSAFA
jgi:hypothetical protein